MNTIKISDLQKLISTQSILWTEHVTLRLRERKLKRADVIECIQNGEIIEQYPDDVPYPGCLIYGCSQDGKPLHIVCNINHDNLCCIITAYFPSLDKWKKDFKTRKAVN
jgi:hypothetical protein